MSGFWGRLFGTGDAAEALVDNISNGVDKLFYTAEEKAEDAAAARTEGFAVYAEWLRSTSGSRIARRFIALIVTGVWAMLFTMAAAMRAASVFTNDVGAVTTDKFIDASTLMREDAWEISPLLGVVLLFYFGGPAATTAVQGLVQKWVNRDPKNVNRDQK